MTALLTVLAVLVSALQPAAGNTAGRTTLVWVNACQAESAQRSTVNVREACACTAGLFAGRMSERQYAILGRIATHLSDREGLVTEMHAMTMEGYTAEEIARVGTLIAELGPDVDRVCGVLE